jgi:uncharacterized membrane protein
MKDKAQTTLPIGTSRLEAFSDAVIAIIITIMILEIHPPHEASLTAWRPLIPVVLAYILSFVVLAIYWNNHHHLLAATKNISAGVMWSNMFLLFWLSMIPVVTAWMGQNASETWPAVFYAIVGFMSGISYFVLTQAILKANPDSKIVQDIGKDKKGLITQAILFAAVPLAFVSPYISYALFAVVAIIWLIPDRRLVSN